jgi:hypothetical protein
MVCDSSQPPDRYGESLLGKEGEHSFRYILSLQRVGGYQETSDISQHLVTLTALQHHLLVSHFLYHKEP